MIMKKFVLGIIGVLVVILGGLYIKLNKSYKDISNKFYLEIDNYNKTVEEYKQEYQMVLGKINTLSSILNFGKKIFFMSRASPI